MRRQWYWMALCGLCGGCFDPPQPPGLNTAKPAVPMVQSVKTIANQPTEFKKEVLKAGTGAEATDGSLVSVHYAGTLADGTKFESSYDSGQPYEFILGAGKVIRGWDKGILGMKEGEKCRLTIPPDLGYGNKPFGMIPPDSTLIFELELVKVTPPASQR